MNRSLFRFALLASLWLGVAPASADEPAKAKPTKAEPLTAEPAKEVQLNEARYAEDLNLLHSRLNLADQINRFAEFNSELTLEHANGLGVDVAVPEAALKAQLNLPEGQGLTVTQVPDDSIGAKAGLKVHDVIVAVGDQVVNDPAALSKLLDAADGKSVKLKLWRAGKQTELEATPKKPEYAQLKLSSVILSDLDRDGLVTAEPYRIGVTLSEADDTLRQQLRLASGEGLVVTDVVADSAAAKVGIQVHDLLTMLDGKRLTTVEAINAQIQELKEKSVELRLLRNGKEVTMTISARKTKEAAFADRALLYWSSKSCRQCHTTDAAHNALAWKLAADRSVWTDGHHAKLFLYENAYRAQAEAALQQAATATAPRQQIEALKSQLAEMQKTLAALEKSFEQSPQQPAKEEDKK